MLIYSVTAFLAADFIIFIQHTSEKELLFLNVAFPSVNKGWLNECHVVNMIYT